MEHSGIGEDDLAEVRAMCKNKKEYEARKKKIVDVFFGTLETFGSFQIQELCIVKDPLDPNTQIRDRYFYHCLAGFRDLLKHTMLNECLLVFEKNIYERTGNFTNLVLSLLPLTCYFQFFMRRVYNFHKRNTSTGLVSLAV